jgi:pyruvate/2-oxoglutarate dehydrogenase complex dihydrolipoamide acyltransferase (E2) component
MIHGGDYRVAPAAGWWMRTYQVLPSEVKATGPKGFILKGDVLEYIEKNGIKKGVRLSAVVTNTAAPVAPKKKPAPAPKKPMSGKSALSPVRNDSNPF